MNTVVWLVQILLTLVFLLAGTMKLIRPRADLRQRMAWVDDFTDGQIKIIGGLEILGGLGLIFPAWTGIAPSLTPIAASALALDMAAATLIHVRRKEYPNIGVTAVLFVLAVFVAWARFGPYSY